MIDTRTAYMARDAQLRTAAAVNLGCSALTDAAYVAWLIDFKRLQLQPPSWRQYRCAVAYVLENANTATSLALARRLRATPPLGPELRKDLPTRTSAKKSKRLPQDDLATLAQAIRASRSPYRDQLIAYFEAGTLTGLRPCEWPSVRLQLGGATLIMTVVNAKANDLRAHSPTRTLLFDRLSRHYAVSLKAWLSFVAAAGQNYPKLIKALGDSLAWISRKTFPRRKKWPTLYTTRHLFAARAKFHYAGELDRLAIVAALLGHASDATASHHYARSAGGTSPTPGADPAEVELVRYVFARKLEKFRTRSRSGDQATAPRSAI